MFVGSHVFSPSNVHILCCIAFCIVSVLQLSKKRFIYLDTVHYDLRYVLT